MTPIAEVTIFTVADKLAYEFSEGRLNLAERFSNLEIWNRVNIFLYFIVLELVPDEVKRELLERIRSYFSDNV